jgi:hypothetical protein
MEDRVMGEAKNGISYQQNYDIVVKWLAEEFRGKTLDILGIETDRIVDVFTCEPIQLPIKAERLDIIVLDASNNHYHIEEQRNMSKAHLYRFASTHFFIARKFKQLTDIILLSGKPYKGDRIINTKSGKYEPDMIDLSGRNGKERLDEIKQAVARGKMDDLLELVFIPLYGKPDDYVLEDLIEELLKYETLLYNQGIFSKRLVAATMIMSNKIISRDLLKKFWEELQMYDIFDIAVEKGMEKGMEKGREQQARELLMAVLSQSVGAVPPSIIDSVNQISRWDVLSNLHNHALYCKDLNQFQQSLKQVMS